MAIKSILQYLPLIGNPEFVNRFMYRKYSDSGFEYDQMCVPPQSLWSCNEGINVFEIFIWGDISSDIRSKI